MKLAYLKKKRVINLYDGNFIGYIGDVILSLPEGNVETLIIKLNIFKRLHHFFSINSKSYIPWDNVVSIGKDVILVNIIDK